MLERGLQPDFSDGALRQVDTITHAATTHAAGVRDLRELLWASIDHDDSRDLDQLSVAEPLPGGEVRILVAIADVDALVKRGSAIDDHARTNTTSVYTAAQTFPMLPEKLSTDLTSLGEGVDREAIVVEMVVQPTGEITDSDVSRRRPQPREARVQRRGGVARRHESSSCRVLAVAGMDEQLRIQDRVAQQLRRRRFERGALNLETLEARAVFDDGVLEDLVPEGRNRAKDLIEDFMIGANGVTARYLDKRGFPSLRRVLRSPERWAKIVALAESVGETLPPEPSNAALEAVLLARRQADPSRFADLSLSVVKLLGRGEYVLEQPGQTVAGHFGLALKDYTHSTAPNRRFPDLLTQRLLKAAMSSSPAPYSMQELGAVAKHCTEQEDQATKVERRVRKSAAALLLSTHIGEHFDAFVTGASPKGTYVRIAHPAAEGKVVRGADGLGVGDRVRVDSFTPTSSMVMSTSRAPEGLHDGRKMGEEDPRSRRTTLPERPAPAGRRARGSGTHLRRVHPGVPAAALRGTLRHRLRLGAVRGRTSLLRHGARAGRQARPGGVHGDDRRWARTHGGRQSRCEGGRRVLRGGQHQARPGAGAEPLPRSLGRVPVLLRPQADAGEVFVCLPGHAGRHRHPRRDFETSVLIQTGKMQRFPFVLMGKSFWGPLVDYLRERLLAAGTIDPGDVTRWLVTDSPDEVVETIREQAMREFGLTYGPRAKPRWWLGERAWTP